jgi:hypothetical protein
MQSPTRIAGLWGWLRITVRPTSRSFATKDGKETVLTSVLLAFFTGLPRFGMLWRRSRNRERMRDYAHVWVVRQL